MSHFILYYLNTSTILIENEPYHKVITNYQNATVKGLEEGDIKIIEFPIPEGNIYPLKADRRDR